MNVLQLSLARFICLRQPLTHWMSPSLAQPLANASSPSGWASLAMAAGLTKKGAVLETPNIERWVFTSVTFRMTRGRSIILR